MILQIVQRGAGVFDNVRAFFGMYGEFAGGVEEDLVLDDLLDHDFHRVLGLHFNQRAGAPVECNQPLLDQCRQLEAPPDLVDDPLFFQFVEHRVQSPK